MARTSLFRFPSKDNKTIIHGKIWIPDIAPKCVVQISHGVTEHLGRYEDLAKYLTSKGVAVIGIDLLGHGKSVYSDKYKAYFGPEGSWHWVVEDIHLCKEIAKEQFGDIPYFMLGFSLGSFLVRTYMVTYAEENDISGYILMGTGQQPTFILKGIRSLVRNEGRKITDYNTSDFIKKMSFGTYNKAFAPNKSEFDWLCANEQSLREYAQDIRCFKNISAGLFRELLSGMIFTADHNNLSKIQKNVPVCLLSGQDDPVGDQGKGVNLTQNSLKKAGVNSISTTLYKGARHDILHEDCKDDVYAAIANWVLEHS